MKLGDMGRRGRKRGRSLGAMAGGAVGGPPDMGPGPGYSTVDYPPNTWGSEPGTFMQAFGEAGGDVGRYGALAALFAGARNNHAGGGMTNESAIQAARQRIRPEHMRSVAYRDGQWRDGDGFAYDANMNAPQYRQGKPIDLFRKG